MPFSNYKVETKPPWQSDDTNNPASEGWYLVAMTGQGYTLICAFPTPDGPGMTYYWGYGTY